MMTVPGASRVEELTIWRLNRAGSEVTVPSSSEGAACTGGGAYCVGGAGIKGNSSSGAATAEPEMVQDNEIAPIASAPKAKARRELRLNASRLSIGGPLCFKVGFCAPGAISAPRWGQSVQGGRFRTFASKSQNGFVRVRKCFVNVSWRTKNHEQATKKNSYILMSSHA